MVKIIRQRTCDATSRYGFPALVIHEPDHTPQNFRKGERQSVALLEVVRAHGHYTSIELMETTCKHGGRATTRAISLTLTEEEREALVKLLTDGEDA